MNILGDEEDTEVTLRELLDVALCKELAEHLERLFKIGIIIFSTEKKVFINSCEQMPGIEKAIKNREHEKAWKTFVAELSECESKKSDLIERRSFADLEFGILPIMSEMERIGQVVMGPFLPEERPKKGKTKSPKDPGEIPVFSEDRLNDVGRFIAGLLDILVFSSYKRYLTNFTHLKTISESYRELEHANQELQKSYEQLKEIDKIKSNFLAMVSHELRTPLTSVIGYSEMLLEGVAGELNEGQLKYINIILEKADQLLKLIRQILNLSKIESGRVKLNLQESNLREILDEAVENIRPFAEKKNVKISSQADAGIPETFALDREKVSQVFNNLLSNAVKFNIENGGVEVKVKTVDGDVLKQHFQGVDGDEAVEEWLVSTVRDTGIGFPKEMTEKIFDSFFQIDSSSTREFGGTGLGLAVAKSFVEMHGGCIWAESEEKKGTQISFALPIKHVA